MRILALVLPLSALAFSAAMAPRAAVRSDPALLSDNMCTPPHDDTTKWTPVSLQMMSARVPPKFVLSGSGLGKAASYSYGSRTFDFAVGEGWRVPESFYLPAYRAVISAGNDASIEDQISYEHVQLASCQILIGNRMAFISSYSWVVHSGPLAGPSDSKHYLAILQFPQVGQFPSAYIAIHSDYKSDLMTYRQVFWTAHFAGFETAAAPKPPACADTSPAPRGTVGEFLDTSVVGMLANGASPPLPKGSGTVLLRFDSTGNVAGVSVGGTLMNDAAQKELGAIVGSNVIVQKPGSVTHVRIKVTVGDSALSYSLVGVGNCK